MVVLRSTTCSIGPVIIHPSIPHSASHSHPRIQQAGDMVMVMAMRGSSSSSSSNSILIRCPHLVDAESTAPIRRKDTEGEGSVPRSIGFNCEAFSAIKSPKPHSGWVISGFSKIGVLGQFGINNYFWVSRASVAQRQSKNCKNVYLVLALGEKTAVQTVVGSIVWCRGSSRLYRLVPRQ